jgi:hypothetical protein
MSIKDSGHQVVTVGIFLRQSYSTITVVNWPEGKQLVLRDLKSRAYHHDGMLSHRVRDEV